MVKLALQYDKHDLYEHAVQCAEAEIDFIEHCYQNHRARPARLLREDFCGTAAVCCEWVKRHADNQAIGVDLDLAVLTWGRENNLIACSQAQKEQIELLHSNVLNVETPALDVILAMNFSYWLFKERPLLLQYFKKVFADLKADGLFFLDAYGGSDSFKELIESQEIDVDEPYNYLWEQAKFNPISNELLCHIHFEFSDGSRMDKAFSYDWRLWTLPEIKELLLAAGFTKVLFYWDKNETGTFEAVTHADADLSWVCYIVAEK